MSQKQLKALRQNQKRLHQQQTSEILKEREERIKSPQQRLDYKEAARLRWFDWLISAVIIAVGVGTSFLVGYLTLHSDKAPNWWGASWFAFIYLAVLIVIWWIVGSIKNKSAERYFNDKRRRYQKTYTMEEANYRRFRRLLFAAIVPLAAFAILITIFL